MRTWGGWTPAYRARVLRAMASENFSALAMALSLGDDGPSARTIEAWIRDAGLPAIKDAKRLHRRLVGAAAVTGKDLQEVLSLLRLDTSSAVDLLGAQYEAMVDAWVEGSLPLPPFVAAHVRTLARGLDGKAVVAYGGPSRPLGKAFGGGMTSE